MEFAKWCVATEESVQTHKLRGLGIATGGQAHAIGAIAKAVPGYYTDPKRVADLLRKLGKPAAAAHVEQKLPTQASIRSGDLGEILCNAYVYEATPFILGIKRLRWKDHRNMSMRGEDVLAFNFDSKSGSLKILKAEVKSRTRLSSRMASASPRSRTCCSHSRATTR